MMNLLTQLCRKTVVQVGSSLGTLGAIALLLICAVAGIRSESSSDVESWFSINDSHKQYVRLRFGQPELYEVETPAGICIDVRMRGTTPDNVGGMPRLPRRPLTVNKPSDLDYGSFKIVNKRSRVAQLAHPLCLAAKYRVEESFSRPEARANDLTPVPITSFDFAAPYPESPLQPRAASAKIHGSPRLHFLTYPVVALGDNRIEVLSEVTVEIAYVERRLRLGSGAALKRFAPSFSFAVPTAAALRLSVTEPGAYTVTGTLLDNIPSGTDPASIQVWRGRNQLPRSVSTSGGSISRLIFFVPPFDKSYYTDRTTVWIRWGAGSGVELGSVDADPSSQPVGDSVYAQTDSVFTYLRSWNSLPISEGIDSEGDPKPPAPDRGYAYWALQYAPGPVATKHYPFTPKSRVIADSPVTFKPLLRGISYYSPDPDHRIHYLLNGTEIGVSEFDDQALATPQLDVQATLLAGSNNFTVQVEDLAGVSGLESIAFYGYYVTYVREMAALNNYLDFSVTAAGSYSIKDFTDNRIRLFHDSSGDGSSIDELHDFSVNDNGDGTYTVHFAAATAGRYYASAVDAYKTAAEAELDTPSELQNITSGYRYLVIAGSGLHDGAQQIVDYRTHADPALSALVVDIQDIYDEYYYGEPNPKAIRSFLREAYDNWTTKPRYVFLVGDSSIDPLGLLGAANRNAAKLPHFFDVTEFLQIPNDSRFAYLSNNSLPDLAIGRLPVTTNAQITDYLDKLRAYESAAADSDWMNRIQTINDNVTASWESPFTESMINVANLTPSDYALSQLDLGVTDAATAKTQLIDAFDAGRMFLYYMGHGATNLWAAEQLLTVASAAGLQSAAPALPFVASMTCLTGTFHATTDSLSEALIKTNDRGAIGVLASSGMTVPDAQALFAETLLHHLYRYKEPIGTVLTKVREKLEVLGIDGDVARSYNLIGDPLVILPFKAPLVDAPADDPDEDPDDEGGDGSGGGTLPDSDSGGSPTKNNNSDVDTETATGSPVAGGCGSISGATQTQIPSSAMLLLLTLATVVALRRTKY